MIGKSKGKGAQMSDPSDAAAVVAAFGAAWQAHDLERTLQLITDDCLFESTGPAPDGAQHKGRDEIRQAWQPIFDDTNSRFEVEESVACGDRVVERRHGRNTGAGTGVFQPRPRIAENRRGRRRKPALPAGPADAHCRRPG